MLIICKQVINKVIHKVCISYYCIIVKLKYMPKYSRKNIIEAGVKYSDTNNKVNGYCKTVSYKNGKGEDYVSNHSYGYAMGR